MLLLFCTKLLRQWHISAHVYKFSFFVVYTLYQFEIVKYPKSLPQNKNLFIRIFYLELSDVFYIFFEIVFFGPKSVFFIKNNVCYNSLTMCCHSYIVSSFFGCRDNHQNKLWTDGQNNSKCLAFFSEKVKNGKFFYIISSGGYYYFFLLVLMWLLLWQRFAESVSCPLYQLVCPESDGGGHTNKGNLLFDQK